MKIGTVTVDPPVMNAACNVTRTPEDVEALCTTRIGVVLVGSITVDPREENAEPRWHEDRNYALNSFGMPSEGKAYYQKHLPDMIARVHESSKSFALNIAGFTQDEYVDLAQVADEAGVDILELNFGCPNISEDGWQKPIVSFDTDAMGDIVHAVSDVTDIPLMLKLSPYSNPAELHQVADMIADSSHVAAVVASNTFPNGYMTENGEPVLGVGAGGVSGRAMLPIALGQVRQFRQRLPEDVAVVGVGGIESREDAKQYFRAGASAVQAATLIVRDGHSEIDAVISGSDQL